VSTYMNTQKIPLEIHIIYCFYSQDKGPPPPKFGA
jgi:hypothetical protein